MFRFLCFFLLFASPCYAANIGIHGNDSNTLNAISFTGNFIKGDLLRLQSHISKLPDKKYAAVFFESDGGSINEALEIGLYIRKMGIRTVVPQNAKCLSACAFAFLAGYDARNREPWRTKSSESHLGFHAFWSTYEDRAYSRDEVEEEVRFTQIITMALINYFGQIDAPTELLAMSLSYDSDDMLYLSNSDALQTGINVWDDVSDEMIYAKNVMSLGTK
ncbi:hypothetical protein [Maritalea porphyrae]|jgi:hypothetical protein|uniref:COG3904 family protein n=1 Tax=Maritalea porphyrae TaxID=880732 RepID=UPI0022B07346|nr:hypothetical protein [Maritalea porphyrae]MCZ4272829.1 hypothetical protein [Maritalea porphyrae]